MADEIVVGLPDGSSRTLPQGSTGADLAASIGPGLAKAAVAVAVDGHEVDLGRPMSDGATVEIITRESDAGRRILRHSTAHVLAQAVLQLWPGTKFAIGPPVDDGFYYDFELPDGGRFSEEDLGAIQERMHEIVAEGQPFTREEFSREEGLEVFGDQPFKREIIEGSTDDKETEGSSGAIVSAYRNTSDFVDLCRGPHVPSTDYLGAFTLTKVAGAYWRGDEHRPQLQRIYGTAWESDDALEQYLRRRQEAEQRDHRRLGAELDLFSLPSELGGGLALWHPKGARIRRLIEDFVRDEHDAAGYEPAFTPHLARSELWETSGHLDFYADSMYPPMEMDGARYYPKPMNCPFHVLIYRHRLRSYRELPLRIFELGTVYRWERAGVLHGLLRIRGFTQDDSHIFCTSDQLESELKSLLGFVVDILAAFGFSDLQAALATRPESKSVGGDDDWEQATEALRRALDGSGLGYHVDEGGGAFYGPKIDVHVRDAIGRSWQLSTLQVDFQLPQRFGLQYAAADGARRQPIMIHRALLGSVERFFGILVEHFAGAFPTWLAPIQVRVLPVRDEHDAYAREVADRLRAEGFRADVSPAGEALGGRVRRAKAEKLPYLAVVGEDDVAATTVGLTARESAEPERGVAVDDLVTRLRHDVSTRSKLSRPG